MITGDRRRSERELFPYNCRRSQTIAESTVAIHFGQRKCQNYTRVVLAGKSQQTTWRIDIDFDLRFVLDVQYVD